MHFATVGGGTVVQLHLRQGPQRGPPPVPRPRPQVGHTLPEGPVEAESRGAGALAGDVGRLVCGSCGQWIGHQGLASLGQSRGWGPLAWMCGQRHRGLFLPEEQAAECLLMLRRPGLRCGAGG